MAKDPAFLFYPGDYLRDTQCFSEKTQVAYDRIMCEHMRNICITQQQLIFFTKRLSDDEKSELIHCLISVDNGFQIHWVAESIEKRRAYSESRRDNRKKKDKKICKTYDVHMENENEDEIKDVKEIINDLNTKANKSYKPTSTKTRSFIRARIADGFKVDDFKTVHDRKCAEWLGDEDNEKFLRPETLYGNKFEGYLNQPEIKKKTGIFQPGDFKTIY